MAFSQAGFDHVGLREIAARAGTDAAILMRLFDSKENLFREVARGAFSLEPAFECRRAEIGMQVALLLLGPAKIDTGTDEFDAFRFLLHSAASPTAAAIVSASLHESFVAPLAAKLGNQEAQGRAALVTACVLGLATMRFSLRSPVLQSGDIGALHAPFAAAIQACIEAGTTR